MSIDSEAAMSAREDYRNMALGGPTYQALMQSFELEMDRVMRYAMDVALNKLTLADGLVVDGMIRIPA